MSGYKRAGMRWAITLPLATAAVVASTSCGSSTTKSEGPEEIGTASGMHGTFLTADEGRAVYLWMGDSGGKSNCTGACQAVWAPVTTKGAPKAGSGVTASWLGTITRSDGSTQVTYNGHPLYYFDQDTNKGDTKGEGVNGFGALWWLVAPAGTGLTTSGSSSSGGSTSTTSGGSTSTTTGGTTSTTTGHY